MKMRRFWWNGRRDDLDLERFSWHRLAKVVYCSVVAIVIVVLAVSLWSKGEPDYVPYWESQREPAGYWKCSRTPVPMRSERFQRSWLCRERWESRKAGKGASRGVTGSRIAPRDDRFAQLRLAL